MPRPVWTGAIAFGLVSVPVKLYTAVRDRSVRFHQLEQSTGARIRYRRVSEQTGEEVDREHIVRGYDLGDGRYVTVTEEELEAAAPKATKTIDIEDFVELADVDPVFFDGTYYLGPADDAAARAYTLLYKAMQDSGRAAVGRFVLRSKQRLVAMRPLDGVLALQTMHFADEVADPAAVAPTDTAEVSERELAAAHQLIDSLTTDWKPERYTDTYREKVLEVVERKAGGEEIVTPPGEEEPAEVIDLVSALRQSVERSRGSDHPQDEQAPGSGAGDEPGARGDTGAHDEPEAARGSERAATGAADLEQQSRQELYQQAQEAGISGRSAMTKEQLVDALRGHQRSA